MVVAMFPSLGVLRELVSECDLCTHWQAMGIHTRSLLIALESLESLHSPPFTHTHTHHFFFGDVALDTLCAPD